MQGYTRRYMPYNAVQFIEIVQASPDNMPPSWRSTLGVALRMIDEASSPKPLHAV